MTLILQCLLLLFLFVMSAFFSCSETALFSLSAMEKKRIGEKYPRLARSVHALLDAPRKTLLTILIGNLFVNTLAAALVTFMAMHYLHPEGVGLVMVGFTLSLIFFSEIIPKVIAVRHDEKMAVVTALPLRFFVGVLAPVRFFFKLITDWIMSLLVPERKNISSDSITEEELKTLVKIGEEDGVLDPQERHMIHKLFELGERPVKDIMIPRIDVVALDINDSEATHIEVMRNCHFAFLPVYQDSMNHILGVVSIQDYMLAGPGRDMKSLLRQPLFIPETKRIDEVLEVFKTQGVSFAVCVDEYGGTDGIVTQEDALEEIFGEYYDEYETPQNPIRRFSNNEYLVEAKISLTDFNDFFNSELRSENTSTLGGYVLEFLGEVPPKGRTFEVAGFEMRIHDVIRNRIHHVMVRPQL